MSVELQLSLISLAVGVIMFLLPHTPLIIIASLFLIFGLLFYPIWKYPIIAKSIWRRLVSLFILACLLLLMGYYVWPHPLIVSPSKRTIIPGLNEKFLLTINNINDTPLYGISLIVKVDKGDLKLKNIRIYPTEESKINQNIGKLKINYNLYSLQVAYKEGNENKELEIYMIYEVGAKKDKEFRVEINGSNIKQRSEVSFSIANYNKEPYPVESQIEKVRKSIR